MKELYCLSIKLFHRLIEAREWNVYGIPANYAVISILTPKKVGEYWKHPLTAANGTVLNLDFSDLEVDDFMKVFSGKREDLELRINYNHTHVVNERGVVEAELLSKRDAERLYDFIVDNSDKNIVVHCEGGASRSVAVAKFILENFDGYKLTDRDIKPETMDRAANTWILYLLEKIKAQRDYWQKNKIMLAPSSEDLL